MTENELATVVVDVGYRIHRQLGPGLLESVYEAIMMYELAKRGVKAQQQVAVPVAWESVCLDVGFRADVIVEGKLLVELKSVEELNPVHKKQVLTYLRMTDMKLGLLMNFGEELFKDGVSRIVNGLSE